MIHKLINYAWITDLEEVNLSILGEKDCKPELESLIDAEQIISVYPVPVGGYEVVWKVVPQDDTEEEYLVSNVSCEKEREVMKWLMKDWQKTEHTRKPCRIY